MFGIEYTYPKTRREFFPTPSF